MNKIISKEQYRSIVSLSKKKGYRLTNCFFLPTEIDNKINNGTLLYEEINNGLLLFEDKKVFYRCYFFMDGNVSSDPIALDKDAVIEIPFNVAPNENQQVQIKEVESMGFKLGRNSGMMFCPPEGIVRPTIKSQYEDLCQPARAQDVAQILELLNQTFNPLYAFLPDEKALALSIDEGKVFVLKKDNDVFGTLLSSFRKNIACIDQVAVRQKYRGCGLGSVLLDYYHSNYLNVANMFQHWVDLTNRPAISMYQKVGYYFSVKKANEYILINGGHEK